MGRTRSGKLWTEERTDRKRGCSEEHAETPWSKKTTKREEFVDLLWAH